MTPKEKAFDLMDKFIRFHRNGIYNVIHEDIAKQYALVAVDEVLQLCWNGNLKAKEYWNEVKEEILKL
jgi:hypothetical protein